MSISNEWLKIDTWYNEWLKMHTWYKAFFGVALCLIAITILASLAGFLRGGDDGPILLIISFIFISILILFHFIFYKAIYLTMYNKIQYNRCINEIKDLTLLLQQKIITEEEYKKRTSILKDELLKYHP